MPLSGLHTQSLQKKNYAGVRERQEVESGVFENNGKHLMVLSTQVLQVWTVRGGRTTPLGNNLRALSLNPTVMTSELRVRTPPDAYAQNVAWSEVVHHLSCSILVHLLLHRVLLVIADLQNLLLHSHFVTRVEVRQHVHQLPTQLAILLDLLDHLELNDLRQELRKLLLDEQRKTVLLAVVVGFIGVVLSVEVASKVEENGESEILVVVDVLDHCHLQLLGRHLKAEGVEVDEVEQCFFASGSAAIQLWEDATGEELHGMVVDKFVVGVVVFDGDKIVFIVIRFGKLDVELRLVERNLTRNVLWDMSNDSVVVGFSILVPVRCRVDVLNDDPLPREWRGVTAAC